jgi:hypothetical protein
LCVGRQTPWRPPALGVLPSAHVHLASVSGVKTHKLRPQPMRDVFITKSMFGSPLALWLKLVRLKNFSHPLFGSRG